MPNRSDRKGRTVKAVHGLQRSKRDPEFELELAKYLRARYERDGLIDLCGRFSSGDGEFQVLIRRALWRALARRLGNAVHIGSDVGFKHLETFEIGNGGFIGSQNYLQGHFYGKCITRNSFW